MAYTIKHMGIGGILDQSISIVKDNFALLVKILLFAWIPLSLINGFVMLSFMPQQYGGAQQQDVRSPSLGLTFALIMMVFGVISAFFVYPLTNAAMIQAIARKYLGQTVTAGEAMRHGLSRLLPLIGTSILMWLAIWGGLILFIIPGIYFAIWFGLSQQVVVIEGLSGPAALGRSKRLVHKDRGKFLALGLIMFAISFAITQCANLTPQPHIRMLLSVLLQSVLTMVWSAAFVVFYFSCRCNIENFDLHYLAQSIGAQPTDVETSSAMARGTI